ncbi:hypothetical protein WSM22_03030 [Cytophagales bacterium WSM2-2]|nr:hypothetical protein WSM22_03030 [Cytophagales bacterium WSM2-2]
MGTLIKWTILAVVVGGVAMLVQKGKELANSFGFSIQGYGNPGVNGTTIDLPINVQFNNPAPVPANIDMVDAKIYLNKNGWILAASVKQPLQIPSGKSVQKLNTRIDLKQIFGGNLIETLKSFAAMYAQKFLQVRTDLTVTYAGVTLPTQQFNQNIQIG